jgi:hypothetical protein
MDVESAALGIHNPDSSHTCREIVLDLLHHVTPAVIRREDLDDELRSDIEVGGGPALRQAFVRDEGGVGARTVSGLRRM